MFWRLPRAARAASRELFGKQMYGLDWGNPEVAEPLRFVRDRYFLPYVNPGHDALEIGPGGGRWTRYLLGFRKLYAVDYYAELLSQLRKTIRAPNLVLIKNNGCDFPGVPKQSIDYLCSFGTFVHLDLELITAYMENMREILKPTANAVIQYSDKTKIMAQALRSFVDTNPEIMRRVAVNAGFKILEEDVTTLWHSSIIRFSPEA